MTNTADKQARAMLGAEIPAITNADVIAEFGGHEKDGEFHDAVVLGQKARGRAEGGQVLITRVSGGAYDGPQVSAFMNMTLQPGLPLHFTQSESIAKAYERKAANDNKDNKDDGGVVNAQALLAMDFPPISYAVPGYIPEGLTILGGRPKLGKSWLALSFAIAVATGGRTLDVECEQGDVIYLALEDNPRRLQDRLRQLLGPLLRGRPDVSRLNLSTEAPMINAGLMDALDAWRKASENPRLIIIDTLAKVRPPKGRNQDPYAADYEAIVPLQRFAGEHGLAVIVVTHVRKAGADDPLEMISGTNGLTGAADSIIVLNRDTEGPKLYGRGRDLEDVEKALKFEDGHWSVLGNADEVKRSTQRKKIIDALVEASGTMTPTEIATETGMKAANVKYLLGKMVKAGEILKEGTGAYVANPYVYPPHSPHSPHPEAAESEEGEDSEEGKER